MLKTAVLVLAGVMALHQLPILPRPSWAIPAFILALLAAGRPARSWVWPFLAGFVWTWWVAADGLSRRVPARLHGQDLLLAGYVSGFVSGDDRRLTFSFQLHPGQRQVDVPARWRLSWYRPEFRLRPGQDLQILVRVRQARSLGNPESFDYEGWLFREGVGGTGYVRKLAATQRSAQSLPQWWLRERALLYERLSTLIPTRGALLGALAVGARHEFTARDWTVLRRTGTSHLVAISGLHVGLVATGAFLVLRALLLRSPWLLIGLYAADLAAIGALTSAFVYTALAGFGVPAQRALLMLAMATVAFLSRYRIAPGEALGVALVGVLAANPLAVLGAGFWLSFGAVATLLAVVMPYALPGESAQGRWLHGGWIAGLIRTQWAIALALAPLLLLNFGELAVLAPLVNLLAVPWFSFVLVPATLLLTLLCIVQEDFASLLSGWVSPLVAHTWFALQWLADVPWGSVAWPGRPLSLVVCAAAGTAAFLLASGFPGRGLFLVLLIPVFTWRAPPLGPGQVRLTVLDVGQGLAALVETRHHVLIYDAGPASPGGFDAGASVVVPALRARGWRNVDRLVVGHGDQDHAGGTLAVLEAFPGTPLLAGPGVKQAGTRCGAGQSWEWDQVQFSFLHPTARADSENNGSCVLRVAGNGGVVLLTGDIQRVAEAELVSRGAALAASVVVVPHHGSATSSTSAFVQAVSPDLAIVPAGFNNRWGMPDAAVVARWRMAGAQVLTTGDSGAVVLVLDRAGVRLERLGRRTRYWHTI